MRDESKEYDIYLYNSDTEDLIAILKNQTKEKANIFRKKGYMVIIVDAFDGVIVDVLTTPKNSVL